VRAFLCQGLVGRRRGSAHNRRPCPSFCLHGHTRSATVVQNLLCGSSVATQRLVSVGEYLRDHGLDQLHMS
jgi:hypothetical protein